MGLFQTDGGCRVDTTYELRSLLYPKVVLHLSKNYYGGKTFTIVARNASRENCYIQSARLNGRPLNSWWIHQREVVSGGTLELELRSATQWHLGSHSSITASLGDAIAEAKWAAKSYARAKIKFSYAAI